MPFRVWEAALDTRIHALIETSLAILLFMPYARLARRKGSEFVLALANLGIIMQMLWLLAIC